ncbi:MAG: transposase [Flavisolibacter sp.]|nr:transposase [Flavisolibacter sp.]
MGSYAGRAYFEDELRSGTRSACKTRYRQHGTRPVCKVRLGYEYTYLYCALEPFKGDLFSALLPDITKDSFSAFAAHFARHTKTLYGEEQKVLLLCDRAAAHQLPDEQYLKSTAELKGMDVSNLVLEHLPAASPELNPVERFFEELRKELSNQVFDTIEEVENKITVILNSYYDNPQIIVSLCNYPYLSTT